MALEIFKLVGSIFVDNDAANKSISETDDKAQGVGKTMLGGLGTAAKWGGAIVAGAAAATTAVAGLASTTVDSYADYEQLVGGVETLFKESADTIKDYADEAYKNAGLTANEYMETVTGFAASLIQSTGRGAQQNLDEIKAANKQAEKELKDSFSEQLSARKKALNEEISEYKKNNKAKSDEGKAYIEAEVKRMQDARDKELKELKKNQEEQLNIFKAANEEKLAEAERSNNASTTTLESQQRAAELANQAIIDMSDNANKMGTSMESIQNAYSGFSKQNYTMLDNLKLGYGGTKDEMERLLADADALNAKQGITTQYQLSSYADIVEAIHVVQTEMGITGTTAMEAETTISGAVGMVKARFENFKTSIGATIAPAVKQFLALVIDNLPTIENMVGQITPVIADLMTTLIPPVMELVSTLLPILVDLFNTLMPVFTQIMQGVLPIIINLLQMILPPVVEIVQKLLPPLLSLLGPILELLGPVIDLLQPILDLITGLLDPIAELITDLIKPLITIISRLIQVALVPLSADITRIAGLIEGTVRFALDWLLNGINTTMGIFKGLLTFLKGVFTGDWKQAWQGIKDIFSSIWEGIKTAFKTPINWIIDGINAFIKGINKIKIPDWVPVVGGKGFSINTIPRLATGGVLEKGQTGFLEGNGAEAVVPLENNKKWIHSVAQDMLATEGQVFGGNRVQTLLEAILSSVNELMGMGVYLDTEALVGGIAKPMDRQLGALQLQKARA